MKNDNSFEFKKLYKKAFDWLYELFDEGKDDIKEVTKTSIDKITPMESSVTIEVFKHNIQDYMVYIELSLHDEKGKEIGYYSITQESSGETVDGNLVFFK